MFEPLTAGIIGSILMLVFLFMRIPICIAMGLAGAIGLYLISGMSGVFLLAGPTFFAKFWSVGLLALPMFILMGNLISQHGIGRNLYDSVYKWIGQMPGGLAVASTIFSALFGFMCGSGLAGTATIGQIAIPEMERRGYNRRLALGTLAVAGSLSAIIPPSVVMIIYAVEASVSLGALFVAGIFPGLILAALMCVYILGRCGLNPTLGPPGEKFSAKEKVRSLVHVVPVAVVFIVCVGGLYRGIWTPNEAGASAAVVVLLIALAYRLVRWSAIKAAALGAAKTTTMIYLLIGGASILSLLFYVSGFGAMIERLIMGLAFPGWATVVFILFIMMIMGMFMDALAMLLVMLPITLPVVTSAGYDPVWWGIMMIISLEMATITPPVAIHLFVIRSIAPKGTTLADVAWGATPFVAVEWVLLGLLIAFPDIVMYLPNVMQR